MLTYITRLTICDSLVRNPDGGRIPQVQGRPLGPHRGRGLVRVQVEGLELFKVILLGTTDGLNPLFPFLYGPGKYLFQQLGLFKYRVTTHLALMMNDLTELVMKNSSG